jgi:hypothetical protein
MRSREAIVHGWGARLNDAMDEECKIHPGTATITCVRCGKIACGTCGSFTMDEQGLCNECGESEMRSAGFPLGTVLIAVAYLALVSVLAAAKEVRPYLLGASALLAIGLARVFSTMAKLRRPTLVRDIARPVRVRRPAVEASPAPATDAKVEAPPSDEAEK